MMRIKGDNFGPSRNNVQIWIGECSDFDSKEAYDLIDNNICFGTDLLKAKACNDRRVKETHGAVHGI